MKKGFAILFLFFLLLPLPLPAAETELGSIFDAIKNNDLDAVKKIKESKGFRGNIQNEKKETPFVYALLYYRNPAILEIFLKDMDNLNNPVGTEKQFPLLLLLRRYADADLIELALQKGADATAKDKNGNGTLIYAYHYFQVPAVMQQLIDAGAYIDQKDEFGLNVLHLAVIDGKHNIAELILNAGLSPDTPFPDGKKPLQIALATENAEIVSLLIEFGAELYPAELKDKTLLMETLKTARNPKVIDVLIQEGLDVQDKDSDGKTPLMYAAEYTTVPQIIEILLENGAYPKTKDDAGRNAFDYLKKNTLASDKVKQEIEKLMNSTHFLPDFYEVIRYGTVEEVTRAIREGADVNAPDYNNMAPLMLAAQHAKDPAVLQTLIRYGANLDIMDESGRRPLIYAADSGNTDVFNALLRNKVDVNATDNNGDTVLMYLAQHADDITLIQRVLEAGADINMQNVSGKSALMTAAEFTGNPETIFLLLEKGADITLIDKTGRTAVDFAKENIRLRRFQRYNDLIQSLSKKK